MQPISFKSYCSNSYNTVLRARNIQFNLVTFRLHYLLHFDRNGHKNPRNGDTDWIKLIHFYFNLNLVTDQTGIRPRHTNTLFLHFIHPIKREVHGLRWVFCLYLGIISVYIYMIGTIIQYSWVHYYNYMNAMWN